MNLAALLPRTLLRRVFLLSALLMASTFAIWGQIFSFYYDEPARAENAAQMVISVVDLTRTALINVDPERRNDLLITLSALEQIHVYPGEPTDEIAPLPDDRTTQLIVDKARRHLGKDTRFASRWKTLEGFWVNFHLDEQDEYWVMLQLERIRYQSAAAWLSWGSICLLAAIIGASLIASSVSMPTRRLALAASQIGNGQTTVHISEDGPEEIAVVAQAFNQMTDNLARAAADRAFLLAGVSHDLRTPLTRLRMDAELLRASSGTDNSAMVTDIETMDHIIGQFLDYGRNETGQPTAVTDLVALVAEIAASYRQRGIQIRLNVPDELPVPAHALPLRRAVINLIDNAILYSGEGSTPEVFVFSENQMACVEVADRGPGIPLSETDRLRLPFTRLDDARGDARGAGLGLSIVDRIVQSHHGHLDLLPREGGGLRAIVRIPAQSTQ